MLTRTWPRQGSINKQISRYETTAVYTHPEAKVDIILVHGLNGEPEKTWTSKNGVFWPADLLPTSLREARANILVYGYNADVYSKKHGSQPSDNFIYMHAQTLITSLTHYRKDEMTSYNPIIWVCHSLGGILVKRALLYSNDLRTPQHEDYRAVYVSTYGIVFLGTPHTGSDMATWGTVLQAMSDAVIPRSFFQSESVLLKTLKRDNETLQNINVHFLDVYQRFKILMAHENHKTDLRGTKTLVVDANSAGPQLPGVTYYAIEATHSGMCKFESKNAPGYRTIATAIREWVLDAPEVIVTRWRVEEGDKLARAKLDIEERMKPWIQSQRIQAGQVASTPQQNNETAVLSSREQSKIQDPSRPLLSEPETPIALEDDEELFPSQQSRSDNPAQDLIFVKPSVFRPNTYFRGREKELKLLHKMLTDRKRRSVGTSSVLIQSMPGGGKSHLARQYVFQHRYDYPGGIFWIRAKTLQELEYGYYDIAKVAGLSEESMTTTQDQLNPTRAVVKAVQAWLSSFSDWLLILDGIHFDFDDLRHFIPFAKNTSIIYTSTERTTGEEYQFDNPQVISLDPFTKKEAQALLFEEMGKKPPYTQDDLQRAEELVELMDRLPLMIHVAALQLKATREPLAKYLRSYKNRPKAGNLPAYHAVCEQLQHRGAIAALNLMSLLAFFGTQIPVEMIGLGAKALDKRTPVKSKGPGSRRGSLNLTFGVLIAFALIERNEVGEASSQTTRSSRSVDTAQDSLDVLRVRGIVQDFFVGYLDERHELGFWLERAICVFCGAFDATIHRVDKDSQIGIPDDYRRFLIHGRRLLSHLDRFEKRLVDPNSCREDLVSRIDSIQHRIDQLAKRVCEAASLGMADVPVSVFERTNSLSESESSPSNPSLADYAIGYGTETLESPIMYSPLEQGPYHWHVPIAIGSPHVQTEWETSGTVTPQLTATEIFESMSMPDDDETTRKVFGSHHRTIKKHAGRRYRDHAGSWRASPQTIGDPRLTMSRETAKGVIDHSTTPKQAQPFSSTDSGPSAQSEAEQSLNQITKVAPKPTGELNDEGHPDALPGRPRRLPGSISHANAEAAVKDEVPMTATFSTSKDAATPIMRLKETHRRVSLDNPAPVRASTPSIATPMKAEDVSLPDSQMVGAIFGEDLAASLETLKALPRPYSRQPSGVLPSRPASAVLTSSTRPSPSQPSAPFTPPPPPPISIEVNTTSSLRSGPPGIDAHRLSTYSIGEDAGSFAYPPPEKPSTTSTSTSPVPVPVPYPYIAETPPKSLPAPPAPWSGALSSNLHPDGYSSQPMSRNTSHQSNNSISSNQSLATPYPYIAETPPKSLPAPPAPWSGSPSSNLHPDGYSSQPMSRNTSHQSNNSISSNVSLAIPEDSQTLSSSPASEQVMQRPRARRRPSVVETEPSPRLEPIELEGPVVTSYNLYRDSHGHGGGGMLRGRKRGRDGREGDEEGGEGGGGGGGGRGNSNTRSNFLSRIWSIRDRTRSESSRRRTRTRTRGGSVDFSERHGPNDQPNQSLNASPQRNERGSMDLNERTQAAGEDMARIRSGSGSFRPYSGSDDMITPEVVGGGGGGGGGGSSPLARAASMMADLKLKRKKSPRLSGSSPLAGRPWRNTQQQQEQQEQQEQQRQNEENGERKDEKGKAESARESEERMNGGGGGDGGGRALLGLGIQQ
ncbi:hypothetical protein GGR50DRAFT_693752 [Xylaria sp. CBS 124048]|nr:hypothetical protein GGR50DRAFT_693752 [Xylaria sp. CBS 124048]